MEDCRLRQIKNLYNEQIHNNFKSTIREHFNYAVSNSGYFHCIRDQEHLYVFSIQACVLKVPVSKGNTFLFTGDDRYFLRVYSGRVMQVWSTTQGKFSEVKIIHSLHLKSPHVCFVKQQGQGCASLKFLHNSYTIKLKASILKFNHTYVDKEFKKSLSIADKNYIVGFLDKGNKILMVRKKNKAIVATVDLPYIISKISYSNLSQVLVVCSETGDLSFIKECSVLQKLLLINTVRNAHCSQITYLKIDRQHTTKYLLTVDKDNVLKHWLIIENFKSLNCLSENVLMCKLWCRKFSKSIAECEYSLQRILGHYGLVNTTVQPKEIVVKSTPIEPIKDACISHHPKPQKPKDVPALKVRDTVKEYLKEKDYSYYQIATLAERILGELDYIKDIKAPDTPIERRYSIFGDPDPIYDTQKKSRDSDHKFYNERFIAFMELVKDGKIEYWFISRHPIFKKGSKPDIVKYQRVQFYSDLFSKSVGAEGIYTPQEIKGLHSREAFSYKILKKNKFSTRCVDGLWDAVKNHIEVQGSKTSPDSLYKVVESLNTTQVGESEELTEQRKVVTGLYEGLQRQKVEVTKFRDLAILDNPEQEETFRQALDSRLILTGIAGTGKTSVILKRIAQNSDRDYILEQDYQKIRNLSIAEQDRLFSRYDNWVCFSPNERVQSYLESAFDADNVRATQRHFPTWLSFRQEILTEYDLLRANTNGTNHYVVTDVELLQVNSNKSLIQYNHKFDLYIYQKFSLSLKTYLKQLCIIHKSKEAIKLKTEVLDFLKAKDLHYTKLFKFIPRLQKSYDYLSVQQEKVAEVILSKLLKKSACLIDIFLKYDSKVYAMNSTELDRLIKLSPKSAKLKDTERSQIARSIYKEFERYLRSLEAKNSPKTAWQQTLWDSFSKHSSKSLKKQVTSLMQLSDSALALKRIVSSLTIRISALYIEFRRELLKGKTAYFYKVEPGQKASSLDETELDIVAFHFLRNMKLIDSKYKEIFDYVPDSRVKNFSNKYRTQVLVDEVADFSTLQVGAMSSISHPLFNSVFLAGDLLQRTHKLGLQSWDELQYLGLDFRIYELKKVYRQSYQMLEIVKLIYKEKFKREVDFISAFPKDPREPEPKSFKYKTDPGQLAWVYSCLRTIQEKEGNLPSVAIFVNGEELVEPICESFEVINERGFKFDSCLEGDISDEVGIKVIDINKVKGIEFEAVFVLDIDKIAESRSNLNKNLLYVALTRSAGYIYLTYKKTFPKSLGFLEHLFSSEEEKA